MKPNEVIRRNEVAYYTLLMLNSNAARPKTLATLMSISSRNIRMVERSLTKLIRLGLADQATKGSKVLYTITPAGVEKLRLMAKTSTHVRT